MQKNRRFVALTYPDFRLLWGGQFVSTIGSQMQFVALNWQIYQLTHSPLALGIIGLVRFVPIVFSGLIAGNFADAHNRKKIMFVTQITMGLVSLIMAITTFTHIITPLILYVLTAIAAIVNSFDTPARQAFIPRLVAKEHLANAMSLNSIVWEIAAISGPAIAGFLIAAIGEGGIYTIDAVSYGAVLTSLLLIKTHGSIGDAAVKVSFHSIAEGLRFVKSETMIWSTMLLDFFSTFFSSAYALLPIFATDILHTGPQGLGILYAAPSIGAVVAGFVMAHFHNLKHQGMILISAVIVYGLATALFGLSSFFTLSLFALFLVGAGDSVSMIIRNTIRQIVTPDHIRGRMTSINMIFFMGGPQLGEFEAGVLASLLGSQISVVLGGIGTVAAVGITAYLIPRLRKYQGNELIS